MKVQADNNFIVFPHQKLLFVNVKMVLMKPYLFQKKKIVQKKNSYALSKRFPIIMRLQPI